MRLVLLYKENLAAIGSASSLANTGSIIIKHVNLTNVNNPKII